MKTNIDVLEEFKAKTKSFELLMKSFDLSFEKCGIYDHTSIKKEQSKTFYPKKSPVKCPKMNLRIK